MWSCSPAFYGRGEGDFTLVGEETFRFVHFIEMNISHFSETSGIKWWDLGTFPANPVLPPQFFSFHPLDSRSHYQQGCPSPARLCSKLRRRLGHLVPRLQRGSLTVE